jgi:hypothetical protein
MNWDIVGVAYQLFYSQVILHTFSTIKIRIYSDFGASLHFLSFSYIIVDHTLVNSIDIYLFTMTYSANIAAGTDLNFIIPHSFSSYSNETKAVNFFAGINFAQANLND